MTTEETEERRAHLRGRAFECEVPDHIVPGLIDYLVDHHEPGGFLMAVITNDLREACARADSINRHRVFEIVSFLYNHAPSGSWGSPEKVADWIKEGRL